MNIKIDSSNNPLPLAPGWDGKARSLGEKSDGNVSSTATGGTSVNIGAASVQLHSMESGENVPVNASKLAEIKQAISEDRFQVNSSAVADSLIKSVIELISSQQT